jgi:hypothetical protein
MSLSRLSAYQFRQSRRLDDQGRHPARARRLVLLAGDPHDSLTRTKGGGLSPSRDGGLAGQHSQALVDHGRVPSDRPARFKACDVHAGTRSDRQQREAHAAEPLLEPATGTEIVDDVHGRTMA